MGLKLSSSNVERASFFNLLITLDSTKFCTASTSAGNSLSGLQRCNARGWPPNASTTFNASSYSISSGRRFRPSFLFKPDKR